MSPTINSPVYKDSESSMFATSSETDSRNSGVFHNSNNQRINNPPKHELNHKLQQDSARVGPHVGNHATSYVKTLSNEKQIGNDSRGGETSMNKQPFSLTNGLPNSSPGSADIHNRQNGTRTDNFLNKSDKNLKTLNGITTKTRNCDNESNDMIKTLSTSEADTLDENGGSPLKRGPGHVSLSEPCLYSHWMFISAAKIFEFLKQDGDASEGLNERQKGLDDGQGDDIPEINFETPQEQMKTFELTFATLKYQKLFRGILDQSGFFVDYPNLQEHYSLVCIILYDLQNRKFQKRKPFPKEKIYELCSEIEAALLFKKTRLQSHVAKERIKHSAPSIEFLVPEQVRNKDQTKTKTPVYLWVNQMKTTLEDIVSELEGEDFSRLASGEDVSEQTGRVFQVDSHCPDLLVFPPHLDMYFKDTNWVKSGHLVQQDKSSCLGPQSVQHLLGIDQDVIHVNVGTGITTAHLASLLRTSSPHSHIWGFGADGPDKVRKAVKNLEFLGAKNTKILTDNFLSVDPDEPKLKSVKVIMISANCSKSAITSPVQFIVSEGEDMRFLGELSKDDQGLSSVATLMLEHEKILRHALRFPRVQAVVYITRSRHEAENESVITRVLEYANAPYNNRGLPFRVTPPVLPFTSDQIDAGSSGVDDRFIRFLPSDKSNGCFVAIISREPDDPKDVARNVIARARSGGLLGKSKSAPQSSDTAKLADQGSSSAGVRRGKGGSRKLKVSAVKHSTHKSPIAIGVRLYKAGLAHKMEQQGNQNGIKPEHLKIVKHPAPFR